MLSELLKYSALTCIAVSLLIATFVLAKNPPSERPTLGMRGLKRKEALEEGGLFKTIEPLIRLVSGWFSGLPIAEKRAEIDKKLVHAGEYLGLSADDFLAMSFLNGLGMFAVGLLLSYMANINPIMVFFVALLGFYLPYNQVSSAANKRFVELSRSLPTAIDLASLCMGAGLDFPGAVRQIVEKSSSKDVVLVNEFKRILQEMELGHTRRKALENFAERAPVESIKDFVGTVVQAEEKGNPLAEVLSIQARMLRMRRSVAAEEAAAKAGLMMMGPLMLIFICVILLLLGPFAVKWLQSGMA